jgi:hypothetical protein
MTNPATWALHLVTHNVGWKLLSLVIAMAIWMLVASEPELSTFATARIEFRNLPDNLELSSEPITSVLLELRGPADRLGGLGDGSQHPAVFLDMSGVAAGERTFAIGPDNVRLPRGVRVVRVTPSEVRFKFEQPLTHRVPVRVRFANEGRNGYHVTGLTVQPAGLEIAGPQSRVERVHAVETDPVDVGLATGATEVRVNAYVDDPFVSFQSSSQVTVSFTMTKQ